MPIAPITRWARSPNAMARRSRSLPCLLGGIFKETGNQAPMITFAKIKGKLEYERLEFARYVKRYALTDFKFNPHFPVNSVMLMRGAVVAETEGDLERYVEAGFEDDVGRRPEDG